MSRINQILQTDAKYRYEGVIDDLFTLADLKTDCDWKFDLPTLARKSKSDYKSQKYINNIDQFREKFYKKYRFMKDIDMSNLLVAGGAIRAMLLNQSANDVDIFVYGLANQNSATKRIEKFIHDIQNRINNIKNGSILEGLTSKLTKPKDKLLQKEREEIITRLKSDKTIYDPFMDTAITAMYNGNTITLMVDGAKLQIILRLYKTPSEIIHGFDLGASAIGFDGSNVMFTTLSKFCYENMVNIFDGTRRSTTYEYRLIKYFDHGFSIVLPNMDISKLKSSYFKYRLLEVCEMPHIIFSYSQIDGNVICVDEFFNRSNAEVVKSDYDFYDDYASQYKIPYYNLRELITGRKKFIYVKTINTSSFTNDDDEVESADEDTEDNSSSSSNNSEDNNDNESVQENGVRYFKLINADTGVSYGRYTGDTPKQAASKAFTKILQRFKEDKKQLSERSVIYLRESTRGSTGKMYGFEASRQKLPEPQELRIVDKETGNEKTIVYHFRNRIKKIPVPENVQKYAHTATTKTSSAQPSSKKASTVKSEPDGHMLAFNETILRYGFVEWCYNMLFNNLTKNTVNMDNVFQYFNVVYPNKLVQELYLSNLTKEQRELRLKEVILQQKQWIKTQLDQLNSESSLKWMTENPTTQLTSSFNPIIEDPKLWYGAFYKNDDA